MQWLTRLWNYATFNRSTESMYGRPTVENRIPLSYGKSTDRLPKENITARSEESIGGMGSRSNENRLEKTYKHEIKIPDPWL